MWRNLRELGKDSTKRRWPWHLKDEMALKVQMSAVIDLEIKARFIAMQVRGKVRSVSTRRANPNLPTLRSSTLISKTIVALSKVDIDSRNIHRDKVSRPTAAGTNNINHTATQEKEKEHMRSQSGFNLRKPKDQQSEPKGYAKMQLEQQNPSQFKLALKELIEEQHIASNQLLIDKAKISSKSYGVVKAYSANSHPGPLLSYNEDRICIVTNLTKTNVKQMQVSFFGVYNGNDGVARADYLRDNFHLTLAAEECFPSDMQVAIRVALRKVNKSFAEDPRFNGDQSTVGFVIIVTFNEEIHYLQSGSCKAVFSSHLGRSIYMPTQSEPVLLGLGKQSTKKSRSIVELMRKGKGQQIQAEYRRLMMDDGLDFVLLGSEGVFENLKAREIGKRMWLYLLKNKVESIHFALGEANNQLLSDVFAAMATKNSSMIILAFESVAGCLEGSEGKEELNLPCLTREGK